MHLYERFITFSRVLLVARSRDFQCGQWCWLIIPRRSFDLIVVGTEAFCCLLLLLMEFSVQWAHSRWKALGATQERVSFDCKPFARGAILSFEKMTSGRNGRVMFVMMRNSISRSSKLECGTLYFFSRSSLWCAWKLWFDQGVEICQNSEF